MKTLALPLCLALSNIRCSQEAKTKPIECHWRERHGRCLHCHMPWCLVLGHTTWFSKGWGCFPLCEGCWTKLAKPEARLPYYFQMWQRNAADADLNDIDRIAADWPLMKAAVLAGK